jgi:hypothetical protein
LFALGGKFNQKRVNYAKQTQFPKGQKCFNNSEYKELQLTMNNERLFKTKPKQSQTNPIYGEQSRTTCGEIKVL